MIYQRWAPKPLRTWLISWRSKRWDLEAQGSDLEPTAGETDTSKARLHIQVISSTGKAFGISNRSSTNQILARTRKNGSLSRSRKRSADLNVTIQTAYGPITG